MSNRSRVLSRGDRRRNDRLAGLRGVVTRESAVVAFDLACDKQVCVVTDPDSRVLARRGVTAKAWQLQRVVEWGLARARAAGFSSVVVACEPTGHRWRVLDEIVARAGVQLVCVQPLLTCRAREAEDFTFNKSDDTDAMIIARLVTELRCYLPERSEPIWARLRQLGARRAGLATAVTADRQQITDLLECAWPAVLEAAAEPLESKNWLAAITVLLNRVDTDGDLSAIRRWGWNRFAAAVRRELPRHGAQRWRRAIVRSVFDAATGPARAAAGVAAQRAGAFERVLFTLADLAHDRAAKDRAEARMVEVLDELGLTVLVTSIPGLSALGAATILAETGDPARFTSARALVKHAGLCPRDNASGTYQGKTTISRRGRPQLRLAAWRAVWPALRTNPVFAARYDHLTTRTTNKLTANQARVAIACSLLRQLHAIITTDTPWNPALAGGPTTTAKETIPAA